MIFALNRPGKVQKRSQRLKIKKFSSNLSNNTKPIKLKECWSMYGKYCHNSSLSSYKNLKSIQIRNTYASNKSWSLILWKGMFSINRKFNYNCYKVISINKVKIGADRFTGVLIGRWFYRNFWFPALDRLWYEGTR